MRAARALATIALVVASLAPRLGSAVHADSCGGSWRGSGTSCTFAFRGLPVTVFGDAEVSSGTARVRAWITVVTPAGPYTIAECSSEASGYASCSSEISIGEEVDLFAQSVPMTCHVSGRSSGTYACASV